MKNVRYANLILNPKASITNMGDWVQLLAIDNIYKEIGLEESDVFRIPVNELNSYRGDKLILPLNFPLFGIYDLSPDIVPVYLGISVIHQSVIDGLRMRDFEPIGCRDSHTYEELISSGLNCYHAGCLSITFPRRERDPVNGKVYLIGLSKEICENLPKNIRENAVYNDHVFLGHDNGTSNLRAARILDDYRDNASLVVTSKIHCAQPCMAMGIPVVFICDEVSFRYEVISQYIPIYTLDDLIYGRVNWDIQAVDLEKNKVILKKNAAHRIKAAYDGLIAEKEIKGDILLISEVDAINRSVNNAIDYKIDMISAFEDYLARRYNAADEFKYAIWGITQFAYAAVDMMESKYPNASLDLVIDEYKRTPFYGKIPKPSSSLKDYSNIVLFAVPSATGMAERWFKDLGVKNYIISYGGVKIEDGRTILISNDEE